MRIAMVTDSYFPTRDGVVTSLTTSKEALENAGHEVFVIAPDPGEHDRIEGVSYFPAVRFKKYEGYFLPILPSGKRDIIRRLNIDVIHIHGIAVMALKALIAARSLKKPVIMTFHTMVNDTMRYYSPVKLPDEFAERLVWIYLRNLLKRPFAVTVPTKTIADELAVNGVKARLEVIPTGIDTERFVPGIDGSAVRKLYGLDGKKVIIHVGRISFEKNIELAVNALRLLDDDFTLMIAGKGPAESSLRKRIEEDGLSDRVVFAGFVPDEDLPSYYAASDVVVSASRFETQGLSVLEAMACGLPAVCSDARAFRDFVTGDNGYRFDGTAEDCAAGIRKCLGEPGMKERARITAESFSREESAKKLAHLYEQAIWHKRGDDADV